VTDGIGTLLLLFVAAFGAGWVDSIAGGGGLITLPVLLGVGLPPQVALGTNKFQASFGSFTAAQHYTHKNIVDLADARPTIFLTAIGAALGTWSVQQLDPTLLELVIPFLLIVIALYMLFTPQVGEHEHPPRINRIVFAILFGVGLGFYDGFFGPGVGSFWAIAFVIGQGFGLTRATGYTKVMNFTSNIVSLGLFLVGGYVVFSAGLTMAAGQIAGARVGSTLVIRKGGKFIKPIYVTVVILTTLKLLVGRFL